MTCAAGDLDCRLDSIISTLQAGPNGWTKAAVIVAAVGVVASTAVAIVAYLASKRAVTIAQGSDDREAKRDEERQRERVDRWLAEFIGAATTYWTDCDAWTKEHKNREYRIRMGARDDDGPAPTPRAAPMLSSLDSARLVSRGDDQLRLRQVSEAVVALRSRGVAV